MLKSIAEEVTVLMAANNIIKTEEIEHTLMAWS